MKKKTTEGQEEAKKVDAANKETSYTVEPKDAR